MAADFNLSSVNSAAAAASVTNGALCCSSRKLAWPLISTWFRKLGRGCGHERRTVLFVCGGVAW